MVDALSLIPPTTEFVPAIIDPIRSHPLYGQYLIREVLNESKGWGFGGRVNKKWIISH